MTIYERLVDCMGKDARKHNWERFVQDKTFFNTMITYRGKDIILDHNVPVIEVRYHEGVPYFAINPCTSERLIGDIFNEYEMAGGDARFRKFPTRQLVQDKKAIKPYTLPNVCWGNENLATFIWQVHLDLDDIYKHINKIYEILEEEKK